MEVNPMGRKFLVEVPDWATDRRVYIFLGRESFMISEPDGSLYKKTSRCNLCGKCCEVLDNWYLGTKEIDGKTYCKYVNKVGNMWFCEGGNKASFSCCSDSPNQQPNEDCVIRYQKEG